MARKPKGKADDLAETDPELKLSQQLAARERQVAQVAKDEDPTLSALPIVSELAEAERKLAQKTGKRRKRR